MAITHSSTVRNDLATKVLADIDAQSNAGILKIKDASNVVLVAIPLGSTPNTKPSGTVSGAVLTFANITTVNCTTAGTAAKFDITDGSGTVIFSGTVTATGGGGDMTFTNLSFASGDPISITNGMTYTAPL